MPGWIPRILTLIRDLAKRRRVRLTYKARREVAALGIGLDQTDVCDVLARLTREETVGRQASEHTGEWMYVFRPRLAETVVYLKVILRSDCVVISFHEEDGEDEG